MVPIQYFEDLWNRCDQMADMHAFLEAHNPGVLKTDEVLRAEWVARVSALDLYVHELTVLRMLEIFEGGRAPTQAFLKFKISNEALFRIRSVSTPLERWEAFDFELREQLGRLTFQAPDNIAEAVRFFSDVELWNEIALKMGATIAQKNGHAKKIKKDLSLIVHRRNKIAHEGDLQLAVPREPWPISKSDLIYVREFISKLVATMEDLLR